MTYKDCCQAIPGLVDKYSVCFAGLEIKLSCMRLKKTRTEELSPQLIIDLCSNISKHISQITDICRSAGEKVRDEGTQDQFKLCVKSVTCAAGCLIASIKSYKSQPNERHHSRVLVFCEPVLASSQALVNFATEDDFIGNTAVLTSEARDAQKSILGACMSIVSASIQLCKTVRDLAYDMMTSHHRDKLRMCIDTVDRVSGQMADLLNKHSATDNPKKSVVVGSQKSAPGHLANLFHQRHLSDRSPESPPNDRFSEILREQSMHAKRSPDSSREHSPLNASLPLSGREDEGLNDIGASDISGSVDGSSDKDSGHSNASR
ncbi:hypothetical protein FSP39_004151 [Pinctada imbricata]|uniref:Talin IBS2B domain-containing protein n=1 Tax=Pinctada imbricata TaxID=66713 RepID=A0AA89C0H7_PINIB|nr:hypothetical protein FSP39_004151 [Pinctada imbricata]